MHTLLFCPNCQALVRPNEAACPSCGRKRQPDERVTAPGEALWQARLPGLARGRPALSDGLVLFAWGTPSSGGGISAFDALSGEARWPAVHIEHAPVAGPLAQAGRVYLAGQGLLLGGSLVCLSLADGAAVWRKELPGRAVTSLCLEDRRVYAAGEDGLVYCFDSQSGDRVVGWPLHVGDSVVGLLPFGRKLVAVNQSGAVYLLEAHPTGAHPAADCSFKANLTSPPVLHNGTLYCGAEGGLLLALELRSGHLRQVADGFKRLRAAPACSGDAVYAAGYDYCLRAFEAKSGRPLWPAPVKFAHSISSALDFEEGLLAVGVHRGQVGIVDAASGQPAEPFAFPEPVELPGSPRLAAGTLYVAGGELALALPWHLGQYAWAADFERRRRNLLRSGELSALAGFFASKKAERERFYQQAEADWDELCQPEWAARLWEGLHTEERRAAEAWCRAAEACRDQDARRAADCYSRAQRLYWSLDDKSERDRCASQAARLSGGPLLRMEPWNLPRLMQGKEGEVTLRVENHGNRPACSLFFKLGGPLMPNDGWKVPQPLKDGSYYDITLTLTPTEEHNPVEAQVEYAESTAGELLYAAHRDFVIQADPSPIVIRKADLMLSKVRVRVTNPHQKVIFEDVMAFRGELEVDYAPQAEGPEGIRPCPRCGHVNEVKAVFCVRCSERL